MFKLTALLDELNADDFDISATGFDQAEINALLSTGNYIEDLLNDDFVTSNLERKEFDVTFTLPAEYNGVHVMPCSGSQAVLCGLTHIAAVHTCLNIVSVNARKICAT